MNVHRWRKLHIVSESGKWLVRRWCLGIVVALAATCGLADCGGSASQVTNKTSAAPAPTGKSPVLMPTLTPTFPLTPSYLPPDVQQTAELSAYEGRLIARYLDPRSSWQSGGISIEATTTIDQQFNNDFTVTAVTVNAKRGTIAVSDEMGGATYVSWLHVPGEWVTVSGHNQWSDPRLIMRVAAGLRDHQQTGRPTFTVASVPAGYVFTHSSDRDLIMSPPGDQAQRVEAYAFATTNRVYGPLGQPTKFGALSGWLLVKEGRLQLTLQISASTRLSITAPATARWNEANLWRFAAGVQYVGPQPIKEPGPR